MRTDDGALLTVVVVGNLKPRGFFGTISLIDVRRFVLCHHSAYCDRWRRRGKCCTFLPSCFSSSFVLLFVSRFTRCSVSIHLLLARQVGLTCALELSTCLKAGNLRALDNFQIEVCETALRCAARRSTAHAAPCQLWTSVRGQCPPHALWEVPPFLCEPISLATDWALETLARRTSPRRPSLPLHHVACVRHLQRRPAAVTDRLAIFPPCSFVRCGFVTVQQIMSDEAPEAHGISTMESVFLSRHADGIPDMSEQPAVQQLRYRHSRDLLVRVVRARAC